MFERPHHRRIAQLLGALDADLLLAQRCLFGGGTAIALMRGEYRESFDADFVCGSIDGYRELRHVVRSGGLDALCRAPVPVLRGPRIDQYGLRGAFAIEGVPVKFEVVFEGRIALDDPAPDDRLCGVWTLTPADLAATKLMANSDRWADDAVMSRDLIDLAMLAGDDGALRPAGVAKARRAYGDSVLADLDEARRGLLERRGRMKTCMRALGVTVAEAELRARVERLHAPAGAPRRRRG